MFSRKGVHRTSWADAFRNIYRISSISKNGVLWTRYAKNHNEYKSEKAVEKLEFRIWYD